jgi:cellulose synthase/poly-beta-1,6-N-acetylglucosamine synthase-like glycosyltransferase
MLLLVGWILLSVLCLSVILYFLLSLFLFVEVSSAILFGGKLKEQSGSLASLDAHNPPAFSVIIPAHNEASGIERTLINLLSEVESREQICVVADNCDDETATISSSLGVTVLERADAFKKGKGYALDFGLNYLSENPPEVVIIIDADCQVCPGTLKNIAIQSQEQKRPVQAEYRMLLPPTPSSRDRVSNFAVTFKNTVRAAGLSRLRLPILLGGTGMAFPWEALKNVDLASGQIVEDMTLGIDLAIAGYSPTLASDALVTSHLPSSDAGASSQRTRWEHGHLKVLSTCLPLLVTAAFTQKRPGLLAMAIDIAIPPLALWVIIGACLTLSALGFSSLGKTSLPLVFQLISDIFILTSVLLAWWKAGRKELPLLELLTVPLYVLWKIPIYLGFLIKPQTSWIRTKRD